MLPLTPEQSALAGAHVRLASTFTREHCLPGWELSDFASEMCLALCRATQTYDPKRGAFSTWAWKIMEGRVRTLKWMAFQRLHKRQGKTWVTANRPKVLSLSTDKLDRIAA